METTGVVVRTPGQELWHQLSRFELFSHFTDEERTAFIKAYEREPGMRVQRFAKDELICHKGEYELDLCFILKGAADLYDQVAGKGRSKVATIPEGAFYGELGALGGLPRTTDVVAGEDGTELFYLPRHCLKFLISNSEARQMVTDRYKDRAMRVLAQELDLFKGVPREFIDQLIDHCEIQRYDLRGIALMRQGEEGDSLFIVRDGYVQVVRHRDDGTHRVIAYLRPGEFFGEMALLGGVTRYADVLTAGKCEVIKLRRADFEELCKRYPDIEARVRQTIERRHRQEELITPQISDLLEQSGQLGVVQADALLVMDLDLCVKCDSCVKACESLHGESRLIRTGVPVGKYLVPAACRHCDDPKCMNSCPTGAIKRRLEGEIYFQYDMCIGCGNCAIACPYDNIAMIETAKFDRAQAKKAEVLEGNFFRPYPVAAHAAASGLWDRIFARHDQGERERLAKREFAQVRDRNDAAQEAAEAPPAEAAHAHVPIAFPIKCDLCDGLPFMGCVHNCPTGAAMRITPAALFAETQAVSFGAPRVRKAIGGND
ncbi:MAG TPA: cyclic nucleotide-binding domain-containing protein [Candidatus Binataceae bacterium]|nr:cyclic nucleotide-binding domain-containing protein [Candidatus Binataceae bacterium]